MHNLPVCSAEESKLQVLLTDKAIYDQTSNKPFLGMVNKKAIIDSLRFASDQGNMFLTIAGFSLHDAKSGIAHALVQYKADFFFFSENVT